MLQCVLIQLTVILFVWSTGGFKLCSLVVSVNLMLLGRLASGNGERGREHKGWREGGRERARESCSWLSWQQGNAPWDRVFPR